MSLSLSFFLAELHNQSHQLSMNDDLIFTGGLPAANKLEEANGG